MLATHLNHQEKHLQNTDAWALHSLLLPFTWLGVSPEQEQHL